MTTTIASTTATSPTTAGRLTSSEKPSTHPLTPIIGAEITGVNLGRAENSVVAAIQAALLDHKVLLRVFASYVTRSEHIVRWRWSAGDVAIWDNRATQHYAVNDYGDAHRVMQR